MSTLSPDGCLMFTVALFLFLASVMLYPTTVAEGRFDGVLFGGVIAFTHTSMFIPWIFGVVAD